MRRSCSLRRPASPGRARAHLGKRSRSAAALGQPDIDKAVETLGDFKPCDENTYISSSESCELKRLRAEFVLHTRRPLEFSQDELGVIWASVLESAQPIIARVLFLLSVDNVRAVHKLPMRDITRTHTAWPNDIAASGKQLAVDGDLADLIAKALAFSIDTDGDPLGRAMRNIHHVRSAVEVLKLRIERELCALGLADP